MATQAAGPPELSHEPRPVVSGAALRERTLAGTLVAGCSGGLILGSIFLNPSAPDWTGAALAAVVGAVIVGFAFWAGVWASLGLAEVVNPTPAEPLAPVFRGHTLVQAAHVVAKHIVEAVIGGACGGTLVATAYAAATSGRGGSFKGEVTLAVEWAVPLALYAAFCWVGYGLLEWTLYGEAAQGSSPAPRADSIVVAFACALVCMVAGAVCGGLFEATSEGFPRPFGGAGEGLLYGALFGGTGGLLVATARRVVAWARRGRVRLTVILAVAGTLNAVFRSEEWDDSGQRLPLLADLLRPALLGAVVGVVFAIAGALLRKATRWIRPHSQVTR